MNQADKSKQHEIHAQSQNFKEKNFFFNFLKIIFILNNKKLRI